MLRFALRFYLCVWFGCCCCFCFDGRLYSLPDLSLYSSWLGLAALIFVQFGNRTSFAPERREVHAGTQTLLLLIAFYISLFSALKQTHCTCVLCDSQWVTLCLLWHTFEYPLKWCIYSAVWFSITWLVPRTFCVHHSTLHQFMLSVYSKPHA